jgi:hypothetical protein
MNTGEWRFHALVVVFLYSFLLHQLSLYQNLDGDCHMHCVTPVHACSVPHGVDLPTWAHPNQRDHVSPAAV